MNPVDFSQVIGNEAIKKQLDCMISKRAIGHALLFAGSDGVGKSLFAWALAARLIAAYGGTEEDQRKIQRGQHPDVHIYRPEGKLGLHSIQSLRQLNEEVYLPPYEASWKVFIIQEADRMLSYSANALLKTFEEPPARTLIILLSRSQKALLPTIISRCCTLHFHPIPSTMIEAFLKQHYVLEEPLYAKIAYQAQGSIGRAVRLAKQGGDAIRVYLLKVLAQGPLANYRMLQEVVQVLTEQIESLKKGAEESAKEELNQIFADQLSAQQQQAVEKELEGFVTLVWTQEAHALLESILSWYRDLHLLLMGGDTAYLANPDFYFALEQAVQRGEFKPLESVYQTIEEAYSALQRSVSLNVCLENLFLKLDRVS